MNSDHQTRSIEPMDSKADMIAAQIACSQFDGGDRKSPGGCDNESFSRVALRRSNCRTFQGRTSAARAYGMVGICPRPSLGLATAWLRLRSPG
jgi:hypothetical protein